jgi:hypothetical protein
MEIDELRTHKTLLEMEIGSAIIEFEKKTGVTVESVSTYLGAGVDDNRAVTRDVVVKLVI